QCWNADPLKRPKAEELNKSLINLYNDVNYDKNSIINKQIKEADEINKQLPSQATPSTSILSYTTHPQAVYTSKLLKFKNLPEPKNNDYSDHSSGTGFSGN